MLDTLPTLPTRRRHAPYAIRWIAEFSFVVDVVAVITLFAFMGLGGADALRIPAVPWIAAVTVVAVALHVEWYRRHRDALRTGEAHHRDLERRGF